MDDDVKTVSKSTTSWKPANDSWPHKVTSVWRQNKSMSAPVKIVDLSYDPTINQLAVISDQAGRMTYLNYNNKGELTGIEFPDGNTVTYQYTALDGGHYLTEVYDNEANYGIEYSFAGMLWTYRVKNIYEFSMAGGAKQYGQKMHAYKKEATYSRFRYYGADTTADTADDLVDRYTFDNYGRTINIITMDTGENQVFGVDAGTYTQNSGTSAKNNRMTSAGSAGTQGTNILYNGGLELSNGSYPWTHAGGGSMALKSSTDTTPNVTPRTGKMLLKVYGSDDNKTSSAYREVTLKAGVTYIFSGYVNTSASREFVSGGAWLSIRKSNGSPVASSETLRYQTNQAINDGWTRLEVVYTAETTDTYRVSVNVKNSEKSAIAADDLQLEVATNTGLHGSVIASASTVNLLQLGSFDVVGAGGNAEIGPVPKCWTYASTEAVPSKTEARSGYSMTFAASDWGKRRASQTVSINKSSDTTFLLSGWGITPMCKIGDGTGLTGDNDTDKRFFGLIAALKYTDSTTLEYHYVSFEDDISGWQYAAGAVVPKKANKTVESITVSVACDYCPTRVYIDDVSLVQEPMQTYSYDSNGNVLIAATSGNAKKSYSYDSSNRLTGYTAINGVKYTLTYSGSSRDPASITSDGVTTKYTYDSNGNVTQTRVQNSGNTAAIISKSTYTADGNYCSSATDANGIRVDNSYNSQGLLASTKTAVGTTKYGYDKKSDRLLTTEVNNAVCLHYEYANGAVSRLIRGLSKTASGGGSVMSASNFSIGPLIPAGPMEPMEPTEPLDPGVVNIVQIYQLNRDI